MINITLNGEYLVLDKPANIVELLSKFSISEPIAVEINKNIIPRRTFPTHNIQSGDNIEIVAIIGGG